MSSKIVLIDGHSILNRAFYGLPDLTNAEGLHTNAIYGFLTIMFKLLEEEKRQQKLRDILQKASENTNENFTNVTEKLSRRNQNIRRKKK